MTRPGRSRRITNHARRLITFTLAFACLSAVAHAQAKKPLDLSLEELMRIAVEPVFGASKRLQPVTEAPASVTIVTREEIARYGYRSLADVLRSVRGFSVTSDRNYSFLGARGFAIPGDYNTRILVLIDGHRMNDSVYEQAAIGREFGVDAAMFERVEIVRGPSSSLYGTSAFFAVVNVIMRNGADLNGISAAAEAGTFGLRSATFGFGKKLASGIEFVLSASGSRSDGAARLYFPVFDGPNTHHGIAESLDDEEARQLYARIKVAGVTVTAAHGSRGKGVPTASFGTTFNDPRYRTTDRRSFVDGEYARPFAGTQVSLRGYFDRYYYNGVYPYAATLEAPGIVIRDYAVAMWAGAEARFTRSVRWRQTLNFGAELRDNFHQAQGATVDDQPEGGFAVRRSAKAGAVYVQDDITLHPLVRATLGARVDVYGAFSHLTPRAALIVTPSHGQAIKYLYGTAFRAPNAYELDYVSAGVRNDSLRPETISSHELVWEQYLGSSLRTSASVYRNHVAGLLTLRSELADLSDLAWSNQGHVLATGLELEGEWRFKRLEGLGSYTLQRTRERDTGRGLTNSPTHTAKLRFSTPGLVPGATIAFETLYLSPRTTLAGQITQSVKTANLTIVQPIGARFDLVGAVRNLSGARYADPGSEEHRQDTIEQDGRTFSVGIRWRFRK